MLLSPALPPVFIPLQSYTKNFNLLWHIFQFLFPILPKKARSTSAAIRPETTNPMNLIGAPAKTCVWNYILRRRRSGGSKTRLCTKDHARGPKVLAAWSQQAGLHVPRRGTLNSICVMSTYIHSIPILNALSSVCTRLQILCQRVQNRACSSFAECSQDYLKVLSLLGNSRDVCSISVKKN